MKIKLSPGEIQVIKIWAENNIHGGHWGDGDIIVPEEEIILNKLNSAKNGNVDFTPNEARIILMWSNSSMGINTYEESTVIKKLNKIVEIE